MKIKTNACQTILLAMLLLATKAPLQSQEFITTLIKWSPKALLVNPALAASPSFGPVASTQDSTESHKAPAFVSLPIIGSLNANAANSFSFNDIFDHSNGAYYLNANKLISAASKENAMLTAQYSADILHIGLPINNQNNISFSIRNRGSAASNIPAGLAELILDNNLNKTKTFNIDMAFQTTIWNEIGIANTFKLNNNWTFGARVKFLSGLLNIQTKNAKYNIEKTEDKYFIKADMEANTTSLKQGQININSWFGNPGMALDIGAAYQSDNRQWQMAASISDAGLIAWSATGSATTTTLHPEKRLEFSGFGDLQATLNAPNFELQTLFDSVWTAFKDTAGIVTTAEQAYSSALPLCYHFTAGYAIDKQLAHNVSVGFTGRHLAGGTLYYGLSAGYYWMSPKRHWQLAAAYTYHSNESSGLALAACLNIYSDNYQTGRTWQFYVALDNAIAPLAPINSNSAGFNIGMCFYNN